VSSEKRNALCKIDRRSTTDGHDAIAPIGAVDAERLFYRGFSRIRRHVEESWRRGHARQLRMIEQPRGLDAMVADNQRLGNPQFVHRRLERRNRANAKIDARQVVDEIHVPSASAYPLY